MRTSFLALVTVLLPLARTAVRCSDHLVAPPEAPITALDLQHWAFLPLTRPAIPEVKDPAWCRTPLDRFILARLEEKQLQPAAVADRLTLLRRATFDLTGLPPATDQIEAFLRDHSPDAYERLIDRLLASPAYGQRWAQHWLDLARFAETDGYEHDHLRPQAWRYRDWVIDALNADLPYDQFVALQVAGDELHPDDPDAQIATGFLLCGPDMPDINLPEERRHMFLNDMTGNVAEVFLGLRMGCAQCHDHKTDPISQHDFYRLRAFFEPIDLFKDHPLPDTGGGEEPLKGRIVRNQPGSSPGSFLRIRGDFRRPGPFLAPDVPRVINASLSSVGAKDGLSPHDRAGLALWLTRPDHPLTARVIVNRLWQHHFGVGLVASSSDFGIMGDLPTHPELLDWLATELIRLRWSLKAMHRLILTSSVYRTASRLDPAAAGNPHEQVAWTRLLEVDPDNRLLGRMRRRRLDGEAIRDAMLAVSGQLNREARGEGFRPPLAPEVTATLLRNQWPVTEDPAQHTRRSIYLFARRNLRYPLFDVFDKPDPNLSCARRSETTIAPQALHLLNSEFALQCAARLAERAASAADDPDDRIECCFRRTLGRRPTAAEQTAARELLENSADQTGLSDLCLGLLNTSEFVVID